MPLPAAENGRKVATVETSAGETAPEETAPEETAAVEAGREILGFGLVLRARSVLLDWYKRQMIWSMKRSSELLLLARYVETVWLRLLWIVW